MDSAQLKAARVSVGLNQRQLADRSGVHFVTLNRYERGNRKISALNGARIAAALDTVRRELANRSEESPCA